MAGACCYDAAFDGFPDKGYITENIEQFMACRLVIEHKRAVVDEAQFIGVFVGNSYEIGYTVKLGLCHFVVVNDNGVIEVSAFDEVVFQQRFDFLYKNECAGGSDLFGETLHIFETGILVIEDRRVEKHHRAYAEMVVG